MSTIASPRDPTTPLPRRISTNALNSPTPSNRPSFDGGPPSGTASPNPGQIQTPPPGKRANRAALREYYNLKRAASPAPPDPLGQFSEVPSSELDAEGLDAEAYVRRALGDQGLDELLRLYTRVLGEIRALDAEKKALVYDNYSKLISATETIRKVWLTPIGCS
jgi:hypothetical protein